MLQYILTENERYSVAELSQMAIEGGCLWISLHLPGLSDEDIRALVAPDVVDMCREASVFLTVDDRPELARDLGLHGVRLSSAFFAARPDSTPMSLRDELGPEAVIGVESSDVSAMTALQAADVDFVTMPASFDAGRRSDFVRAVRAAGFLIPIVAQGDFTVTEACEILADGCNGIALGKVITDASDPVKAVEEYLTSISR